MEYSKDIIFNVKYNEVNNILKKNSQKNWTSTIKKKISDYKMIFIIMVICVILIAVDMILIFNFTQLLQNSTLKI